jgi:hypothetical protein
LRFSRRRLWRMTSSGKLHRVALVRTDVSEELSASFVRATRIVELGTTSAVTSNGRTLRRNTKWTRSSLGLSVPIGTWGMFLEMYCFTSTWKGRKNHLWHVPCLTGFIRDPPSTSFPAQEKERLRRSRPLASPKGTSPFSNFQVLWTRGENGKESKPLLCGPWYCGRNMGTTVTLSTNSWQLKKNP